MLELLDTGMARAEVEGGTLWLRRPKFGELRLLRQRQVALSEDIGKATEAEDVEDLLVGWWSFAVHTLWLEPLEVGDWPLWVLDGQMPSSVMDHWRHVPLGCWRQKADDPFDVLDRPPWWTGTVDDEFTPVYLAMSHTTRLHGPIPPPMVDLMEITTVAAALGLSSQDEVTYDNGVPSWWSDDEGVAEEMMMTVNQLASRA